GLAKGDRIAIAGRNTARHVLAIFAVAKLGAICVPVNDELGVDELSYMLAHASISGMMATRDALPVLQRACECRQVNPWYVLLDDDPSLPIWQSEEVTESSAPSLEHADPESVWVILYTSGTTGLPKGVMHTQRSFTLIAEAFVERMHLQPSDRLLCILPLFHINALFYSVGGALAAGAALIVEPRFSASRFWQIAVDRKATEVNIIAAVGSILARRATAEFRPEHCLCKVYGAPITAEIADTFRERFGITKVVEGYGLTEAPGVCNHPYDDARIGTMGKPSRHPLLPPPFAEMRLIDEDGKDVGPSELGEILLRTPAMMKGYYHDDSQTREAFRDGWLQTGDIARRDEDGFYTFIARKKDLIRRRGENVSAAEVERIIKSHPAVRDVAVIGTEAELGEEEIFAVVLPVDEARIEEGDIGRWCEARLARFKVPRYVTFVKSLPYTPSHRVAKHRLKSDRTLLVRAVDLNASALSSQPED
ncbi:MAG: class I adenylate-forming enzyme family protein, partial [Casimicrobiaceae bacterium]